MLRYYLTDSTAADLLDSSRRCFQAIQVFQVLPSDGEETPTDPHPVYVKPHLRGNSSNNTNITISTILAIIGTIITVITIGIYYAILSVSKKPALTAHLRVQAWIIL